MPRYWLRVLLMAALTQAPAPAFGEGAPWISGGNLLAPYQGIQLQAKPCSDLAGGAFVVWTDARRVLTHGNDIYMQHVTWDQGVDPSWPADGVRVIGAAGDQVNVAIAEDGEGGALVAWMDGRNELGGSPPIRAPRSLPSRQGRVSGVRGLAGEYIQWPIYVQRVSADGSAAPGWPVNGCAALDTSSVYPDIPTLISDGAGGAYVAWTEDVSGTFDVRVQHINSTGAVAAGWPSRGRSVSCCPNERWGPSLAPDGNGGVYVAWDEGFEWFATSHVQHIQSDGALDPGWDPKGIVLADPALYSHGVQLAADETGGVLAAWSEFHPLGGINARLLRLTAAGEPAAGWDAAGTLLRYEPGWIRAMRILSDRQGGAFVAWMNSRETLAQYSHIFNIFTHHVLGTGAISPGWPAQGVEMAGTRLSWFPDLALDESGGVFISWDDTIENAFREILDYIPYAQHLGADGSPAAGWMPGGLELAPANGYYPRIAGTRRGRAIVAWNSFVGGEYVIRAQCVGEYGITPELFAAYAPVSYLDRIELAWEAPTGFQGVARVWRSSGGAPSVDVGAATLASDGRLEFVDRDAAAERSYRYTLRVEEPFDAGTYGAVDAGIQIGFELRALASAGRGGPMSVRVVLPHAGRATVELFDVRGRLVERSAFDVATPSVRTVEFKSAPRIATGIYIARLRFGADEALTKLVRIR